MANKSIPKQIITAEQEIPLNDNYENRLRNIPKTYQKSAKAILQELKRHPSRLQIDQQTNEITIDGEKLVHSNLIDLISDVVRPRKTVTPPLHGNRFLKLISDLNLEEELIGNKTRVMQMRKYKSNTDSKQDEVSSLPVDDDILQNLQRQVRILKAKQSSTNLKKSKRNQLQLKPYKGKKIYSWKTV